MLGEGGSDVICLPAPHPSPSSHSANRCQRGSLCLPPSYSERMITAIGGLKRGSEPPVNEEEFSRQCKINGALSASAGVSNICTQCCLLGFICICWLTPDSCANKSVSLESEDKNIWTWAPSLVAQRLKHLPAMNATQVRSLGWEDTLEKEMATHSSILA